MHEHNLAATWMAMVISAGLLGTAAPTARAQAAADKAAVPAKVAYCVGCHGPGGNSTDPQYPMLAGQTARYLYLELQDFKAGRRSDPQMSPMATGLSSEDMLALAQYFSAQKPAPHPFKADPAKVAAGRKLADAELCAMCHLGGFSGQNEIPRVAGQHYAYIVKQLQDFKAKRRTNDAGNMTSVASTLSNTNIEDLAQYIANL